MVRTTAAVLIVLSLAASSVYAEAPGSAPGPLPVTNIRASIERIRFDRATTAAGSAAPQFRFQQRKPLSVATKISVGFVGGLLGFWGGGALGAAFQPPCHCDDPGLQGFMIGAPIGAVLGAIGAIKLVSP